MTLASWREVEAWIASHARLPGDAPGGVCPSTTPLEASPASARMAHSSGPWPRVPLALLDGWAVRADATEGAHPGMPVLVERSLVRPVRAFEPLDPGFDAVLPEPAIRLRGSHAELTEEAAPGDFLVPPGAWLQPGEQLDDALPAPVLDTLLRHRLGAVPGPAWAPAGGQHVLVPGHAMAAPWVPFAQALCTASGVTLGLAPSADPLGPGQGEGLRLLTRDDPTTQALLPHAEFVGLGLVGAETVLLGRIPSALPGPVAFVVLPEAPGPALAVLLGLVVALLRRLAEGMAPETRPLALATKLVSPPGLAQVALLLPEGPCRARAVRLDALTPFRAIGAADAWMLLPSEAEGLPEGAVVQAEPLPWAASAHTRG